MFQRDLTFQVIGYGGIDVQSWGFVSFLSHKHDEFCACLFGMDD
jgi:hypothetical protein